MSLVGQVEISLRPDEKVMGDGQVEISLRLGVCRSCVRSRFLSGPT
jgi:hypothetical protein